MVFRVLMEEYGGGRYTRKHSTFYKTMMQELGLETGRHSRLSGVWSWVACHVQAPYSKCCMFNSNVECFFVEIKAPIF